MPLIPVLIVAALAGLLGELLRLAACGIVLLTGQADGVGVPRLAE